MQTTKRYQMPLWLSRTLLLGLGVIFVLLPIHAFVSTWGGTTIGPLWLWKSWKELLLALLFVMTFGWLAFTPAILRELFRRPFVIVLSLYVLLTLVMAVLFREVNGTDATMAGLAMNLRYLLGAVLVYLLFRYGEIQKSWMERAAWFVIGAGIILAVLGIIQSLLLPKDLLTHFGYDKAATIAPYTMIDDNPKLLRAFATLRGPNDFGAFLILPIVLVVAYAKRLSYGVSTVALLVMMWALFLSSSRSAWLGLVVALGLYLATWTVRRLPVRYVVGGCLMILIAGAIGLYAAATVPSLRAAVFHSSPGDPSLTEGSTDNHVAATTDGIKRVVARPLGCGPGCAGPASYYGDSPKISENYFVQIAEEVGVVGLGLFSALLVLVSRELLKASATERLARILVAVLAGHVVIGLLLHVWVDDPLSLTLWMLIGVVLGYTETKRWTKSKNKSRSRTSSSS